MSGPRSAGFLHHRPGELADFAGYPADKPYLVITLKLVGIIG